jgi:hypothetical protein
MTVAEPCDTPRCATLISDTGSGRLLGRGAEERRAVAETTGCGHCRLSRGASTRTCTPHVSGDRKIAHPAVHRCPHNDFGSRAERDGASVGVQDGRWTDTTVPRTRTSDRIGDGSSGRRAVGLGGWLDSFTSSRMDLPPCEVDRVSPGASAGPRQVRLAYLTTRWIVATAQPSDHVPIPVT